MSREVDAIAGRLSLRDPQRASLEILDKVCRIAPPCKQPERHGYGYGWRRWRRCARVPVAADRLYSGARR